MLGHGLLAALLSSAITSTLGMTVAPMTAYAMLAWGAAEAHAAKIQQA